MLQNCIFCGFTRAVAQLSTPKRAAHRTDTKPDHERPFRQAQNGAPTAHRKRSSSMRRDSAPISKRDAPACGRLVSRATPNAFHGYSRDRMTPTRRLSASPSAPHLESLHLQGHRVVLLFGRHVVIHTPPRQRVEGPSRVLVISLHLRPIQPSVRARVIPRAERRLRR